jgi:hypothetical protein
MPSYSDEATSPESSDERKRHQGGEEEISDANGKPKKRKAMETRPGSAKRTKCVVR